MTSQQITIKGRKLYRAGVVVGEITGWRQMTAKWGATGPGYGYRLYRRARVQALLCVLQRNGSRRQGRSRQGGSMNTHTMTLRELADWVAANNNDMFDSGEFSAIDELDDEEESAAREEYESIADQILCAATVGPCGK